LYYKTLPQQQKEKQTKLKLLTNKGDIEKDLTKEDKENKK
jgi:hypothetical protein